MQEHAHTPDTIALLEDLLPFDHRNQLITQTHLVLKRQVCSDAALHIHDLHLSFMGSRTDVQVVVSYLQGPSPDIESSVAALEAYFTEPLQALADTMRGPQSGATAGFAEMQLQAAQLQETISHAQSALQYSNYDAVQLALEDFPVSLADKALQDALSTISSCAGWSDAMQLVEPKPGVYRAPHSAYTVSL